MIKNDEKGGWRKLPVKPEVLSKLNQMEMERQIVKCRMDACILEGYSGSRGGYRDDSVKPRKGRY